MGAVTDLIGGGKAAGNIIVIALPGLAFTSIFPMLEVTYEHRCVHSLYHPLWPSPQTWRRMHQTDMPAGLNAQDTLPATCGASRGASNPYALGPRRADGVVPIATARGLLSQE